MSSSVVRVISLNGGQQGRVPAGRPGRVARRTPPVLDRHPGAGV